MENTRRKPEWLRIKLPNANDYANIKQYLKKNDLHTICESGNCPNQGECWGNGTATFMILGDICTRSCRFCAVKTGKPLPPDYNEPIKIAEAIKKLNLKHCVLTSVDRDDLPDGGASIWASTVNSIKAACPSTTIETLIPDFKFNRESLDKIIEAHPEVVSHNLETVKRLTPEIRNQAIYNRSLNVLEYLAKAGITTKSGIMLGIGETEKEIFETMDDLLKVGCKIMTIGQYLQPTKDNLVVEEYIHPSVFFKYEQIGKEKGFDFIESGALVRSSYHAEKHVCTH
ncbi:MAG: lipoyl synthase [Bacteroidota bacterium]